MFWSVFSQLAYIDTELAWISGPWFNIKMPSYQFRKSHCGDKTVIRLSYLHIGISYTGKMASLYWIGTSHISPRGWAVGCVLKLFCWKSLVLWRNRTVVVYYFEGWSIYLVCRLLVVYIVPLKDGSARSPIGWGRSGILVPEMGVTKASFLDSG